MSEYIIIVLPTKTLTMNIPNMFKNMTRIEMTLAVVFVLYTVLPIDTPAVIAPMIDSSLGMLVMFCVTLYLFLYSSPVLGLLYILVAYELLRRSSKVTLRSEIVEYVPSEEKRQAEMIAEQPEANAHSTLEEEVIAQRAPLIDSQKGGEYVVSDFKPVADTILAGTSLV